MPQPSNSLPLKSFKPISPHTRSAPKIKHHQSKMTLSLGALLLEYCAMDVVFVSIDFENVHPICDQPYARANNRIYSNDIGLHNCQVGISILDTRDLKSSSLESAIKNRQFNTGSDWYKELILTRLVFGASENVKTIQELPPKLNELLRFTSAEGHLRPIVVVGFDLAPNSPLGDIACINKLTDPRVRSPIIDYLDLYHENVVTYPYKMSPVWERPSGFKPASLKGILEYLEVPYARLHIATNDANATLRAALIVAVREHEDMEMTGVEKKILIKLQTIALMPIIAPPGVLLRKTAFKYNARQEASNVRRRRNKKRRKQERKIKNSSPATDFWDAMIDLPWDAEAGEASPSDTESSQILIPVVGESFDGEAVPNLESSDSEESSGCAYSSDEDEAEEDLLACMCLRICPAKSGIQLKA